MKKYDHVYNVVISARRAGMTYGMTIYLIDTLEEMIQSLKKRYAELLVKIYIIKILTLKINFKNKTGK